MGACLVADPETEWLGNMVTAQRMPATCQPCRAYQNTPHLGEPRASLESLQPFQGPLAHPGVASQDLSCSQLLSSCCELGLRPALLSPLQTLLYSEGPAATCVKCSPGGKSSEPDAQLSWEQLHTWSSPASTSPQSPPRALGPGRPGSSPAFF